MRAWITREPIDPAVVLGLVGGEGDGAVVLFLGTVRDHNDGRRVSGMTYEAYGEMAQKVIEEIAAEAAERAGSEEVAVVHRVGALRVGEASVAIAVASAHRAEAYEASRHVIEQIKVRLPVWKKEHYVDGPDRWVGGVTPRAGAGRE